MLGFGWLAVRKVQAALAAGRLEETQRLLLRPAVRRHSRYLDILNRLALAYVARSQSKLEQNEVEAAWQDLLLAEQTGMAGDETARLRQVFAERKLADTWKYQQVDLDSLLSQLRAAAEEQRWPEVIDL